MSVFREKVIVFNLVSVYLSTFNLRSSEDLFFTVRILSFNHKRSDRLGISAGKFVAVSF